MNGTGVMGLYDSCRTGILPGDLYAVFGYDRSRSGSVRDSADDSSRAWTHVSETETDFCAASVDFFLHIFDEF